MSLTQIPKGLHAAKSVDTAALDDLAVGTAQIAASALSADTTGRTKMADGFLTQAKLAAGVAGNGPAFSAYLTANQSVSSGVVTKVALNAEEFDTDNAFDSTTNFRFQPAVAGYYAVHAHVGGSASTAGTILVPWLYKNGAQYKTGQSYIPPSGSSSMNAMISGLVYLNGSTDYLELWAQNTGSGTNTFTGGQTTTWFQGHLARAA